MTTRESTTVGSTSGGTLSVNGESICAKNVSVTSGKNEKPACGTNATTLVKTSGIVRKGDDWARIMARSADGEATIFLPDKKRRTAASRQVFGKEGRRTNLSGAVV
jgi:hypothetical protein